MLALISPAKKLDFTLGTEVQGSSIPDFLDHAIELVDILKPLPPSRLQSLMKLSEKLGQLNYDRYQSFSSPFTPDNAKPAILTFKGDTYVGLDAQSLSQDDLSYAQDHLRCLSGLYGLLRPLDLIQPYRLEMGTKLANAHGEDLYDFWGGLLAEACNAAVKNHKDQTIISLASNEYIKAVRQKDLNSTLITCHFKELKDGQAKTIGLYAKRARGMMARYMVQQRVEDPNALKDFNQDGYEYIEALSDEINYVFLREKI